MNVKIAMVAIVVGIMALCLVAAKPIGNQAFAYCDLTLKADPGPDLLLLVKACCKIYLGN
jgi:hypothetical protein